MVSFTLLDSPSLSAVHRTRSPSVRVVQYVPTLGEPAANRAMTLFSRVMAGRSRPLGVGLVKTTIVKESVKQEAAALGLGTRAMQEGSRLNLPRPTTASLCGPTVDLETLVAFRAMRSLMEVEAEVQGAQAATGTMQRSALSVA